ncbi:hypothetical protein Tco_0686390 [Tanacetum coccineum]
MDWCSVGVKSVYFTGGRWPGGTGIQRRRQMEGNEDWVGLGAGCSTFETLTSSDQCRMLGLMLIDSLCQGGEVLEGGNSRGQGGSGGGDFGDFGSKGREHVVCLSRHGALISGPRRARLTKYTGICLPSLSVIKTALMASLAAAKYIINSSFSLGAVSIGSSAMRFFILFEGSFAPKSLEVTLFCAFLQGFEKGSDFSADFDKNLFKLASFPFSFCTSLRHLGDGKLRTASALSGHTLSPSVFTL